MERAHIEQALNYGSLKVSHAEGLKEHDWGFRHAPDGTIATIQCTPFYSTGIWDVLLYRQRWDVSGMTSFAEVKKIIDGSVRLEPLSRGFNHQAGPFFVTSWLPRISRDDKNNPVIHHYRCRVVCVRCGWQGRDRSTNVSRFMISDADSHTCWED